MPVHKFIFLMVGRNAVGDKMRAILVSKHLEDEGEVVFNPQPRARI